MSEAELDKPGTVDYQRPAARAAGQGSFSQELIDGVRAWARHTFSVASLISGLKSLLWVAPLSVIIWIYAEQEDVAPPESVTVPISVESADPSRVVRLLDPANGKVTFVLTGANANLGKVKGTLESLPQLPIPLPESALATPGPQDVSVAMINNLDLFRTNGITVKEVLPHDLKVDVDIVDDAEVNVEAAPNSVSVSAPPVFTPQKVHIKAPASVIKAAKAANKLVAYAHLEGLTPGPHDLPGVPLTLPFDDKGVTIVPSTVSAHVEIKESDARLTRDSIPVRVTYPPTTDDKYKAVYDPVVPNITVVGPPEQIRALKDDPNFQPQPWAWFDVDPKDVPGPTYERHLNFVLPGDLRPSPEDAKKTISFHLIERHTNE